LCEFKVYLDGKQVAEDVIFARQESDRVIVRDIIGEPLSFEGTEIVEVDVMTTRLILGRR
jgi:predicted RNA-binding protein